MFSVVVWWWRGRESPGTGALTPPSEVVAGGLDDPEGPPSVGAFDPELPSLDASDEWVRTLAARLSSHPRLAAWLATDDLIRRFVRVVVEAAGNANPSEHVRHMAPEEPFRARSAAGRSFMSPESYRRYDLVAGVFASLDPRGTGELYRRLLPLLEGAYRELGVPGPKFHEVLEMAVDNVLSARILDEPPELLRADMVYVFRDPELEERRGLEKLLLRMGPENTRLIQEALRRLAPELGVGESR